MKTTKQKFTGRGPFDECDHNECDYKCTIVKSKHTKGPLQIRRNDEGYLIESECELVARTKGKANARLIAAAPEMYSELVRMIDVMSVLKIRADREDPSGSLYLKLQIDTLNDLVKKARGES